MHTIIGVDCATQPGKTGMARAHLDGAVVCLDEVAVGSKQRRPVTTIASWVRQGLAVHPQVLIALDAPLGWPADLGRSLTRHQAGNVVGVGPDLLFSRRTDRAIAQRLKKRPLEVGANLIARTAHAALQLLDQLRQELGEGPAVEVRLVWGPEDSSQAAAIEVYPAATWRARRLCEGASALEALEPDLRLPVARPHLLKTSPHARDAVVCALAGADFLLGKAVGPGDEDLETAKKEGWIWARWKEADERP